MQGVHGVNSKFGIRAVGITGEENAPSVAKEFLEGAFRHSAFPGYGNSLGGGERGGQFRHHGMQAQSEQDECLEETKALLKKVSEYDLAQKRLQITAGEQRQIRKALNRLRSKYLAAGRYSDGIDKIIIQVAKPNTTRHMFW